MRNKHRPYVPYRTAYVCHYRNFEQWSANRECIEDARTHEHPNHADLRKSGGTKAKRGYAEPKGAHGIGKLKRPPFPENHQI